MIVIATLYIYNAQISFQETTNSLRCTFRVVDTTWVGLHFVLSKTNRIGDIEIQHLV